MIVDGRALASQIIAVLKEGISVFGETPVLTVFTCAPNFETKKFLALKERRAKEAGIAVRVVELPEGVLLSAVQEAVNQAVLVSDGVIIQFPFPHLATKDLIPLIPASHDVDMMIYDGQTGGLLPPVVGAIAAISDAHGVTWEGREVVVVGNGRLVGAPAADYAASRGAVVKVVTKDSNTLAATKTADIVILGAGVPGLLTYDMVKEGVVVFDAGTSEEGGMLVGDADPAVAEKARLFTPVPGGIGPLTVAILLKNVLYLAKNHRV
ncbi:MAG: bifunctional 5,10-methylenetetrahydrofolate dehydrogenase/5,10-methenyltetrahydrofolate cyclohydrolase [Candidatus Pacebacteria bacterium]|jgi:methylenetetrahydrofolate dehydrogenase (NADP+)/methenyltetrahydrofolate cyclohydrolase|nr:bifunctional 5,10-methylenetetrahydrofolate dehydrogenase/5,10-methenyltetrahydrofolate cyclohydrolase [Candidatus Paceibacterota bacterium]